ncbi:hypothetical protein ACG5V6_15000 [Streptomyces chitinivorans]|uniref:Uncharacterized protein n=1 Tax=Streptomyces chitinivorans TaxID=1257027 RepID=A0ABW7HUF9_9ACTN|nr:hypothetical protein [Streptomyces chitinivorans]MDH2407176.1 hypothetical protein [Streptomyces chitinivorans]
MNNRPAPKCAHWIGSESRYCNADKGVRRYVPGHRCPDHTPAALAGRPEPQPGPGWPSLRKEVAG